MFEDEAGPIERFEWGVFTIAGQRHGPREGVGKDVCLIGRTVTEWKERKGHRLTWDMVTGVVKERPEVLVIGNGVYGALECPGELLDAIKHKGVPEVYVLPTPEACRLYNELLRQGRKVALLAHGTC